jgi:hypothetical protein
MPLLSHDKKIIPNSHINFTSPYSFKYLKLEERNLYYFARDLLALKHNTINPVKLSAYSMRKSPFQSKISITEFPHILIPDFTFFYIISGLIQKNISLIYILNKREILEDYLIIMLLIFPSRDTLNTLINEIHQILGYLTSTKIKYNPHHLKNKLIIYMEKNPQLEIQLYKQVHTGNITASFIDVFKYNTFSGGEILTPDYSLERLQMKTTQYYDAKIIDLHIYIESKGSHLKISIGEIKSLLNYRPCPNPSLVLGDHITPFLEYPPPHLIPENGVTIVTGNMLDRREQITIGHQINANTPHIDLYHNRYEHQITMNPPENLQFTMITDGFRRWY